MGDRFTHNIIFIPKIISWLNYEIIADIVFIFLLNKSSFCDISPTKITPPIAKTTPQHAIFCQMGQTAWSVNCGKNANTNSTTLELGIFVRKPQMNPYIIVIGLLCFATSPHNRQLWTAKSNKHNHPKYLIILYAIGYVNSNTDSPSAPIPTCTKTPDEIPIAAATPLESLQIYHLQR